VASQPLPFDVVLMVPRAKVLDAIIEHDARMHYGMTLSWDIEFPVGVVIRADRFSAIDHAAKKHLHAASVGRPTGLTGNAWEVYREVIEYDLARWRESGAAIEMLVAWTINDPAELAFLVEKGVSGIITDDIPMLKRIAKDLHDHHDARLHGPS